MNRCTLRARAHRHTHAARFMRARAHRHTHGTFHAVLTVNVKVKLTLKQAIKAQRGSRGINSSTLSLTSALGMGEWPTPHPTRFTPRTGSVPIVQEAGWAPGPVWTGVENLASTRIRSPGRPARIELLYRLSYHGTRFSQ
jgi:hypothetical protein